MIDIGVASPRAHGHAIIKTETAATIAYARLPKISQTTNAIDRDDDHSRDEICRHDISQSLYRSAASLSFADHANDLGEKRVASDSFRFHNE
jgi:hypothetical protein